MELGNIFLSALQELWVTIAGSLPRILAAIIVFVLGLIVARLLFKAIVKLVTSLKLDNVLKPTGLARAVERAGYKLNSGRILGYLVKWFVVIVFLITALDILELAGAKELMLGILAYIPQVIVAVFVLLVAFILGDFVRKLVKGSTKMLNVKSAAHLGGIARIAIIVFAVIISMNVLNIGREVVMTLFIGVVSMLALAGGLAFGLGGRDAASKAIERAQKELNK